MLDVLRAWLNGKRDFAEGVKIYFKVGENLQKKSLFLKGKTDFSYTLLQEELTEICQQLKAQSSAPRQSVAPPPAPIADTNANPELYEACKREADKKYKEAMNIRAVLFNAIPSELSADPNRPDLVLQRKEPALQVMQLYNEASYLYDRANYVKQHGRLPEDESKQDEETQVHDVMVYYTLTACLKNYNKLKNRSPTPERVRLLQKYVEEIKKLEERWHLLKQAHQ